MSQHQPTPTPADLADYLRRLASDGAAIYPGRSEMLRQAAATIEDAQNLGMMASAEERGEVLRLLGSHGGELPVEAAHRVVTQRDQAVDELQEERKQRKLAEGFHQEKVHQVERERSRAERAEAELARLRRSAELEIARLRGEQ